MTVDLPLAAASIRGFALSNLTSPGPRNFDQVIANGGGGWNSAAAPAPPRPAAAPRPAGSAPRAAGSAPRPAGSAPRAGSAPAGASPRPRPPRPRPVRGSGSLIFGPSSLAHTFSANGSPTVAVYFSAIVLGGPMKPAPLSLNFSVGGVFLFAASPNG